MNVWQLGESIGYGTARFVINQAIKRALSSPIDRLDLAPLFVQLVSLCHST